MSTATLIAMTDQQRRDFDEKGFVYITEDSYQYGPFPDFYHSTFHSPAYVFRHWNRFMEVEAYIVRGSLGFQDFVLLRRR